MKDIEQLLRNRGIRATPIRMRVLSRLTESGRAYTNNDLESAFNYSLDRVSLYRCLLTLTKAGLLQKHIDAKGTCSYFATPASTVPVSTVEDYPHFKCTQCELVVSLPKLPAAYLAQLHQYQLNSLRLLGEGTCDDCRHRAEDDSYQRAI